MNRIYLALARWSARKADLVLLEGDGCDGCHQPRGRHDRYQILAWRHTDCKYPATHPLPETLMSEMEKGRV